MPSLWAMTTRVLSAALAALALGAPAARAAVDGPVTRLADTGGRADVIARADGSAVAVWESGADVHFCRIAAGAGVCTTGSEKVLAPGAAAGTTTSRPFVFDLSGNRIAVVRGECCPQHTYRWVSADNGATFAAGVDFASVVPADQGAAVGPGDGISLLGEPARYQLASATGAAKTTAEATLDATAGLTGAHAVALDPATSRPIALWGTPTDAFASGATTASPGLSASWAPRAALPGVTGMRLSGPVAAWVRNGRHELARWSNGAFGAGVPLADAPDDAGEADVATDAAGGVHLVFSPPGSGAVCYAGAAAGSPLGAPILLGRDDAGVAGLQVSASGVGQGRVVFTTPAAGGPVSILSLAQTTRAPNVCGLAPTALAIARPAGRSAVNVALDPAGQPTTYHVEYGPTTAYGSSTPDVAVAAADGPTAATVELGALAPGHQQHARLVATNATGTTTGPDLAFRTPPLAARATAAALIGFPSRCSGRRVRLELRRSTGATPALALIRVRSRKPVRLGAKRLQAGEVTLTGLPARRVRVSVKLRLADGRILRRARTYARCS
ncbi:MAG: hypothetical protein JWM73_2815 [Solirubrobacterales bacterium]|nr:hypothetical protein [Solirubrobacterales bacterium]